jgi:mannose-1-phosphate guanylyltransferase
LHDAFVLAAGLGTRLRPLTDHRPKPLVPVVGVPMLSYALALCARHGLRDVVVNAHWLADQLRPWEGERPEGVRVSLSVELPEVLGTGGGLARVASHMAPRFAVVNADVLADVDLGALLAATPEGGGALALRVADADHYGVVATDARGRVVRLRRFVHPAPERPVDERTHFTGLCALHRDSLRDLPEGFSDVVAASWIGLAERDRLVGRLHSGLWYDVGDPGAYLDANLALLADPRGLPLDPLAQAAWARSGAYERGEAAVLGSATIQGNAWVGRGAESVIGAEATVAADSSLLRCVVWDGAQVPAGDHVDTIFFDGGSLRVTPEMRGLAAPTVARP